MLVGEDFATQTCQRLTHTVQMTQQDFMVLPPWCRSKGGKDAYKTQVQRHLDSLALLLF